ncbi:bifunctional 3-phenylpropionate/cinnamic acid dioxygenase ferredoxin subunit [Yaniella flava]|uniref:Bifunctional 3-phenylpropionate/cinnamic acid dioxygenase ferredoxin subunit n=1 Tax=Yaniella flava TaxID=287930 RepID=A0ABP5GGN5_9MICC
MTQTHPIIVGTTDEIQEGEALYVSSAITGTAPIAVFHTETGEFYALDDRCTHGQASLAEGFIKDELVECPRHAATFCLRNGKVLSLPATVDTNTHQIEIVGQNILLYPGVPATDAAVNEPEIK